jgi:hypothetical protein
MPNCTEAHVAYGNIKTFFYEHNICELDEQNNSESGIGSFISNTSFQLNSPIGK